MFVYCSFSPCTCLSSIKFLASFTKKQYRVLF